MTSHLVIGGLLALLVPMSAAAQDAIVVRSDALVWKAPPFLQTGAQFAVVMGDPAKEGPYVVRVKFPAGFKVAPHMHPNDESLTVLQGAFHLGTGDKFDEAKAQTVKLGDYARVAKGTSHFGWAEGESILQLQSVGPAAFNYVNPADDPRKK